MDAVIMLVEGMHPSHVERLASLIRSMDTGEGMVPHGWGGILPEDRGRILLDRWRLERPSRCCWRSLERRKRGSSSRASWHTRSSPSWKRCPVRSTEESKSPSHSNPASVMGATYMVSNPASGFGENPACNIQDREVAQQRAFWWFFASTEAIHRPMGTLIL